MGAGIGLVVVAAGAFVVVFLGYMGLVGKLPPNRWAGIRTPFTRKNDENWYNTHRAAAPVMIFGGVLVLSIALALIPFAFAERLSGTFSFIAAMACAVLLLTTVGLAWYAGTAYAAARATQQGDAE
jgi:uncharacterized membrane protein